MGINIWLYLFREHKDLLMYKSTILFIIIYVYLLFNIKKIAMSTIIIIYFLFK